MERRSHRPSFGVRCSVWLAGIAAASFLWSSIAARADEPSIASGPVVMEPEPEPAFSAVYQEPPNLPAGEQAPPAAAPAGEAPSELRELEQLLQQPVVSVTGVPIVTSASRRDEKATAAPATVIVIDRQDIVLRGYSQLSEVLRDLPGMETIEYFFSEFGTQVPVRGISGNNKILVLVNGMRVNPPGGENFPFRNDFSVRHAERIEVVYGAGSTMYGQDVISAVINVVTIDPAGGGTPNLGELDDPLSFNRPDAPKSAGGSSFEAGAEAGVYFEREAWAWYGGELGCCRDVKVSGYVQYHDSELMPFDREFPGYWQDFRDIAATKTNADGAGIDPSRSDFGLNLFGRVEWRDWSFQVWHRQSQRNSAEGYTDVLGFLPQAKWGDSSLAMEGKNTRQLTDNVTLESAVTYDAYEINPSSRYVFPDGSDSTKWFLDDFKYGRGWRVGLEETVRADVTDNFSLLGGGLAWYSDIIPKATFPGGFDPNLDTVAQGGSFFYSDTAGGTLQSIPRVSEILYWTYAAYLEGQWQMLDDLRLIAGVRVTKDDHFDQIPITPRASVIYNVTDRLTAKYMYTEAFVAPAPYFAFSVYDRGDILAQANPSVSPETAKTHEVNLTYDRENVSLGFSAYYGAQGNLIIISDRNLPQNLVDPQVFLNGDAAQERRLVQTSNGGISERFGTDLYGKVTWGSFRSWFSYSYIDLTENNAGTITGLPGISRHNGRLGTTWRATPKLFITPSLVIRSTPEGVVNPGRLVSELDTPYEINLYALYRHTEHLDLFLDLRNITDNHYALVSFAGDAYPQETFSGMAGLRLTY